MPDLKFQNILNEPAHYIDKDEAESLISEGVKIPENVIYIPVSLSDQPETFNKIVEIKEVLPDIDVLEIFDYVKTYINPDAVVLDIPNFLKHFPGKSGTKVIEDIKNGVPLSDQVATLIVKNNLLLPAQDSFKFKKLLPFARVIKKVKTKKAAKKSTVKKPVVKAAKVAGKVSANVATFGIAKLMKGLGKKIKAKKAAKKEAKAVEQQQIKQAAMVAARSAPQVLQKTTNLKLDLDPDEM